MMFWQRLYQLCKENNTSPTQVVKELGIAQGMVTKWKNGTEPNAKALLKISKHFDVSTDYLLGKKKKKNKATPEEQPLTDAQAALLNYCSDLSNDDLEKVIDYIELLKLKNNATQKANIKLVARSGEQKEIETSQEDIDWIASSLNEDTTSDY